jgi:hypothetical protein
MRSPVADLLGDAAAAFDEARVEWFLFGAQAAILYGVARLTADVDITVRLPDATSPEALANTLDRHGFQLRVTNPAFLKRTSVMPFVHRATSLPLDVVLSGPGLEDRFFARTEIRDIEGVRAHIASAEDLIVMKTLAGRPKDVEDVTAILASSGAGLDVGYIRDTLLLLERALGQSDLTPVFERALGLSRRGG